MNSYESYEETSQSYDETREPIGIGVILGCLALGRKRLDQIVILDAGCGTGNYSRALLEHVGRIEAVDMNRAMIEKATEKLREQQAAGRIRFQISSIAELRQEDASLDGVMINQVLHHLADDATEGYPAHRRVIEEFYRVLRPGGVLVINTCSQEQLRHGHWFFDLIPEAAEKLRLRYMPLAALRRLLEETGFTYGGRIIPADALLQGKASLDPRGPLKKQWRDGDSTWSLATQEELDQALARVRKMEAEGRLQDFVKRLDARRFDIGQTTFLYTIR